MIISKGAVFVLALESEGQGLLEPLGFDVLYCGVGKINAAYQLTRYIHQARMAGKVIPMVINFGSAGSHRFMQGEVVEANTLVQRDMDARGIGFALGATPFDASEPMVNFVKCFDDLPSAICGTGDSFAQGVPEITCDVVDMEAYALAKVCTLEEIRFTSVKYITDGADGNASVDWESNLKHAAKCFKDLVLRGMRDA